MTAVNIDGEHSVRIKRGDDKWFTDGRLPLEAQLRDVNFADAQIDRGHMVRREDPNWDPRRRRRGGERWPTATPSITSMPAPSIRR